MKIKFHDLLKIITLFLLIIALIETRLDAQSYFSMIFPQETGTRSARSLSLGMVGVSTQVGIENVWTNPALLNTKNQLFSLTLNGHLQRFEEKRSYPVMDMFDDVVMNNSYVSNRYWYSNLDGGIIFSLPKNVYFGLARSIFWDFTYDYTEEVRGSLPTGTYNRDPLRGYHEINRSGKIISTDLGFSFSPFDAVKIGVGGHWLNGKNLKDRYNVNVLSQDDALASDTTFIRESEISLDKTPVVYTAGISVQPKNGLTFGFSYQTGVECTFQNLWSLPEVNERTQLPGYKNYFELDTTGYMITILPDKYSFGIEVNMKNPIDTKSMLEFHYTDWSKFTSQVYSPVDEQLAEVPFHFQETWEIRGGVEHIFQNKIPFRFGFIYSESPLGQEFETTRITTGGSYKWGNATFDFGIIFGGLTYRYEDLFKAVSEESEFLDTVKEFNTISTFSITYSL